MKRLEWTQEARLDLIRLIEFLEGAGPQIALEVLESIERAAERLRSYPNIGTVVDGFENKEVRHIIANHYELRYGCKLDRVTILRVYHTREDRP